MIFSEDYNIDKIKLPQDPIFIVGCPGLAQHFCNHYYQPRMAYIHFLNLIISALLVAVSQPISTVSSALTFLTAYFVIY